MTLGNRPRVMRHRARLLLNVMLMLLLGGLTVQANAIQSAVSQRDPGGLVTGPADAGRASTLVSSSVPASRQADTVVVITMEGPIDAMTSISVRRRIAEAEAMGADAIVIDIDSPGGEVGAILEICNAIKSSPISNSVGWVNDQAYSGGAIVALACRRLIASSPASIGDALPILFDPFMGAQRVPEELRAKVYPPVIAELTDSARRYGYDEYLVQAIASDRIELWQVERVGPNPVNDGSRPDRFTIDEDEYRQLFQAEPPRGKPMLGTIGETTVGRTPATGPIGNAAGDADQSAAGSEDLDAAPVDITPGQPVDTDAERDGEETSPADTGADGSAERMEDLLAPTDPAVEFNPAGDELADVSEQITAGLTLASTRPIFDESQRGMWRLVQYVSDGTGPIVMRDDQLAPLGFPVSIIHTDEELREYFAANTIVRIDESWSESTVRFMTSIWVRGLLIVVLLLGIFVEMVSPGLIVPSGVALVAFLGLVIPPMLVGMAGWWEVAAILGGVVLIGFEIFITPGFGIFGVTGLISLFAGLIGTFTPNSGTLPGTGSNDLLYGTVTVLLAFATTGVAVFFITKYLGSIPVFNRLILQSTTAASEDAGTLTRSISMDHAAVAVGAVGVAGTDLRPVGRAEFEDDVMLDVYAAEGYLPRGSHIRVVEVTRFRVVVERAGDPNMTPSPDADDMQGRDDGSVA